MNSIKFCTYTNKTLTNIRVKIHLDSPTRLKGLVSLPKTVAK